MASQEALLGGPGAAVVGRTVGDVDEQLEREEGERMYHERKRDDLVRKQVGVRGSLRGGAGRRSLPHTRSGEETVVEMMNSSPLLDIRKPT